MAPRRVVAFDPRKLARRPVVGEQVRTNLNRWHPRSIATRQDDPRYRDRRDDPSGFDSPRSLPQPMIFTATPHNELDPDDPHQNGAHTFDQEEGDVVVPEPCWDQYPSGPDGDGNVKRRYYNPTRQWGDQVSIDVPLSSALTLFPFDQLIDFRLHMPAVITLRLSAVCVNGILAAPSAKLFVTWTVDYGCGRATQTKPYHQLVGPADGNPDTDIVVQSPCHALRVSGVLTANFGGGLPLGPFTVHCTAACAPQTSFPDMVSA
jgi:hypothetical protein